MARTGRGRCSMQLIASACSPVLSTYALHLITSFLIDLFFGHTLCRPYPSCARISRSHSYKPAHTRSLFIIFYNICLLFSPSPRLLPFPCPSQRSSSTSNIQNNPISRPAPISSSPFTIPSIRSRRHRHRVIKCEDRSLSYRCR